MNVKNQALALVNALLNERDDIGSVPIPPSARRYARMKSSILFKDRGMAKPRLYIDQVADTTSQADKKQGFKNYDGSAYTAPKSRKKEPKLEAEGARDWIRRYGIMGTRRIQVERDPSDPTGMWFRIPVFDRVFADGLPRRMWNMIKPGENAKQKLKDRLQHLVRHRAGYKPGDIFLSPFGNFLVTDSLGIKEV